MHFKCPGALVLPLESSPLHPTCRGFQSAAASVAYKHPTDKGSGDCSKVDKADEAQRVMEHHVKDVLPANLQEFQTRTEGEEKDLLEKL